MAKIRRLIDILGQDGPFSLSKAIYWRLLSSCLSLYYRKLARPRESSSLPKVIEVSASDIQFSSRFSKNLFPVNDCYSDKPLVGILSGPWDKFRNDWEEMAKYRIIKERFEEGNNWDDIKEFQNYRNFKTRARFLEKLYDSLDTYGYLRQEQRRKLSASEVPNPQASLRPVNGEEFPNECFVGIGRNGEIIRFTGAQHRISIAKLLDLEDIPVVVVIRHHRWQSIRMEFMTANSRGVPKILQEFRSHPDIPN